MTELDFIPDFSPSPMQRLLDYIIENYSNIEGLCPNTGLNVGQPRCVECNYDRFYGKGKPLYGCKNFRKVYLVRFLITHIEQTSDLIKKTIRSEISNDINLSAISFGGGPGVEALALMAQLNALDIKYELLFDNIDSEPSWEPIYRDLIQAFLAWVENVQITPRFSKIDVIKNFTAPEYDIVFVPWILSDLDRKEILGVLSKALGIARSNRYVVITDRPQSNLIGVISGVIEQMQGWDLVDHEEMFRGHCGIQFPDDVRNSFRAQLKYRTAYWVLKKHETLDIPF